MKRIGVSAVGVATAVVLVAGCGSSGTSSAGPTPSAATHGCLTAAQAAAGSLDLSTRSGPVGAYFRNSDAGNAKVGVVFSPQAGGSLCDWLPHYATFTAAGYAVLGYMVGGGGPDDVRTAIGQLKSKGVSKVVLVGASKGASASLETAADSATSPLPVVAVVSLSSPLSYPGESSAERAVATSTVPTFFGVETQDGKFPDFTRQLHATAVAAVKELKVYPGVNHGAAVLTDGALPDVRAFLDRNAPAAG
ncbi:alpha/beta hydrolase family protein [Kitasatospora sp. NPDC057223]|uniref:alpha/beta hydrolase family protein n=1 Tax=Kitasatospora sp. NPDC057223 TaxID=3346055 RepID=UPI003639FA31